MAEEIVTRVQDKMQQRLLHRDVIIPKEILFTESRTNISDASSLDSLIHAFILQEVFIKGV